MDLTNPCSLCGAIKESAGWFLFPKKLAEPWVLLGETVPLFPAFKNIVRQGDGFSLGGT